MRNVVSAAHSIRRRSAVSWIEEDALPLKEGSKEDDTEIADLSADTIGESAAAIGDFGGGA